MTDTTEMQRTIQKYDERPCDMKFNNLEETEKFLEIYKPSQTES